MRREIITFNLPSVSDTFQSDKSPIHAQSISIMGYRSHFKWLDLHFPSPTLEGCFFIFIPHNTSCGSPIRSVVETLGIEPRLRQALAFLSASKACPPECGKIFPRSNRLDDYRNRSYTGKSAMLYYLIKLRPPLLIPPTHSGMLGNRDFTMVACDSINASLNSKQLPDWCRRWDLNPQCIIVTDFESVMSRHCITAT